MTQRSEPSPDATPGRPEVLTVYLIGLFQGLSLVAFPAAATILTSPSGYNLSKSQYGVLFVPQVALAIAGSLALPRLATRFTLKRVLLAGLVSNTLAMGLLAGTVPVKADGVAFPMLLVATAALGLGFGLTLGSISTYAGAFMPERRDVALTALNVLLGLGTALSPFLISLFTSDGEWWYLPLLAAAGLVVLIAVTSIQKMEVPAVGGTGNDRPRERGAIPSRRPRWIPHGSTWCCPGPSAPLSCWPPPRPAPGPASRSLRSRGWRALAFSP